MAWEGSTRRSRLPANWAALRGLVLQRDDHRCTHLYPNGQRCERNATDVDHVNPGDNHHPSNLRSLCGPHHAAKSGREGSQAAARVNQVRAAAAKHPREEHPGLR